MRDMLETLMNAIKLMIPKHDSETALEALTECGITTPLANENNVVYTNSEGKIYIL